MSASITLNQYKAHMKLIARWNNCTHFGVITSCIDRTNNVPDCLIRLGVPELISYLLINEKANAFIYRADLGRKNPIQIVEIYHDWCLRATEWREPYAEIAMRIDDDLVDGLDDGVAVPEFVVPFLNTAMQEVMLNY